MFSGEKVKTNIFLTIFLIIVMPIVVGQLLNRFFPIAFISLPIHSVLEVTGGVIAIVISLIFYMKYRKSLVLTHFNWATTALLAMGIIDIFHASVMPGEISIWLHSSAVFFGGILFVSVWLKQRQVSKKQYSYIPIIFILFSLLFSVFSIIFSEHIPLMINTDKTFSTTANMLNIIGAIGFFIASLKFILIYINSKNIEDILFAGYSMLFGIAGVLFVSSVIWDMQWWLWHILRLSAYVVAFYFLYSEYQKEIEEVELSNNNLVDKTAELKNSIAFLESFQKATDEGNIVSKSDLKGNITYVNDNFCKATGYTREEVMGKPHSIIRHPDNDASVFEDLWKTIKDKKTWKATLKNRTKDGSYYWVKTNISPLLNDNGDIIEYIAIRHDITELINQRDEIEKNSQTDTLTGVGNRFKLINDINDYEVALLSLALINIDNFREINDFYGHKFGDFIIVELANRLSDYALNEKHKNLYRIQGDEFAILNCSDERDDFISKIDSVVSEISQTDFVIDEEEISLQITAALSFEKSRDNLFSTADMTMKMARRENKYILVYEKSQDLNKASENNIKWTKKLKMAIKEDRLLTFYQPIVNNHTGKWEKYESLIRMIDENGKVISPFFFLDIAKRTKNYIEITKTVIRQSFEMFDDVDIEFSVNLTIGDIMDEFLREFLFEKLEEYQNGDRVVFEIVESEGIENFDKVLEFIEVVKARGCKIAIDDFGTGYSNFEYLLQLKADYIKIDGSMIKNLDTDSDARAVVSTIVDFAKKMGMKTIAEFVKDETIESIVKEIGIDYSQGFYFSEPKYNLDI